MSCRSKEHLDRISYYLDGELGECERRQVREHLVHCDACRAFVVEAQRLDARIAGLGRESAHVPRSVDDRILLEVVSRRRRLMPRLMVVRSVTPAMAGTMVAAMLLIAGLHVNPGGLWRSPVPTPVVQRQGAPSAARRIVALERKLPHVIVGGATERASSDQTTAVQQASPAMQPS